MVVNNGDEYHGIESLEKLPTKEIPDHGWIFVHVHLKISDGEISALSYFLLGSESWGGIVLVKRPQFFHWYQGMETKVKDSKCHQVGFTLQ